MAMEIQPLAIFPVGKMHECFKTFVIILFCKVLKLLANQN